MKLCRDELARAGDLPSVASDLRRRLAELAHRVGDEDAARRHTRDAVHAFDYNLQARTLLMELERRGDDPVARVQLLLDMVSSNPARGATVWELARYLDDLSLHDRAAHWYRWSIDHFKRRGPGARPPLDISIDLAACLCDAGRYEQAFDLCNQAMAADPARLEAQSLMIRIARLRGLKDVARKQCEMVATRLQESEPAIMQSGDAAAAARAAWFHIEYKPDPARALRLATVATKSAPDDPAMQRLLGWAKLISGDAAGAENVLAPIAKGDQFATVGLARAQLQQDRKEQGIQTLRAAEKLRYSGAAYEKVVGLLEDLGEHPAAKPDRRAVIEVLDAFDRSVLSFYDDPSKVLKLDISPVSKTVAYAEPITCTFTLSNVGPYPITLGHDGMVASPQVLVSGGGTWLDAPRVDHYLFVSLLRDTVLAPGDKIVVRQTLDVGPLATALEPEPQRQATLEFSFLLDPVLDERGRWRSRLDKLQVDSIRVTREQVDATPGGLARLTEALRGGTQARRSRAVHAVAALIAERRRAQARPIDYTARSVDDAALQQALLATLKDTSPLVRARTLDALVLLKLDAKMIESAAPLLADGHWLVRMLAIDLFANAQGPVFEPVVKRLSAADPDPLVKALAQLYVNAWHDGGPES
ncbi:MAG: hypothetical protein JSV19_07045 [Phycisphaerales bacterium]|nr:MAG: hypothetical protein JSV19_07045 [Phycisphaerales bacterium]